MIDPEIPDIPSEPLVHARYVCIEGYGTNAGSGDDPSTYYRFREIYEATPPPDAQQSQESQEAHAKCPTLGEFFHMTLGSLLKVTKHLFVASSPRAHDSLEREE